MNSNQKEMPWWLNVALGIVAVIAGILLLAAPGSALGILVFLVGLGVFVFAAYNLYKAVQARNESRLSVTFLVHGLLDIVLLLLIIVFEDTPALLGIIIASWFIVFGVFEIMQARKEGYGRRTRIGVLLVLAGIGLIIIPPLLQIGYDVALGIIALVFGFIKTTQGIVMKNRLDDRTSGGRANLM